jgi:hypothetical protein
MERKIVINTETLVMVVKSQENKKSSKYWEITGVTGVPEEGVEPRFHDPESCVLHKKMEFITLKNILILF